jgi:flagellar motor switch protein FliG
MSSTICWTSTTAASKPCCAKWAPSALAVALRGAEPEVQDKILRNMSKRAAEILKDDMDARGPVKLTEVEAAQKEIVVIAQRLAEEGN